MANELYTVTVLGWEKHNGKKKKGHANIMLSTRFFDDEKIETLSLYARLVYVWILLRCGDEALGTVSFHARQVRVGGRFGARQVLNACTQLQELQLVKVVKSPSLKTLQDKTLREETRQEEKIPQQQALLLAEPAPLIHPLVTLWNLHRGKLPEARSCSPSRLKRIRARWPEQTPEAWVNTVCKMSMSDFCNGKSSTGWRADFEFLLKPDTWAKVNEGKYDNGSKAHTTRATQTYDQLDRLEQEWQDRGAGK